MSLELEKKCGTCNFFRTNPIPGTSSVHNWCSYPLPNYANNLLNTLLACGHALSPGPLSPEDNKDCRVWKEKVDLTTVSGV